MNKPKVKLEEVVQALDLPEETQAYLNTATGEVSWFPDEVLSAAQDEDVVIEDYPEWERDLIVQAKSLLDSDDFLGLPGKFDFHEYRVMERFCQSNRTSSTTRDTSTKKSGTMTTDTVVGVSPNSQISRTAWSSKTSKLIC